MDGRRVGQGSAGSRLLDAVLLQLVNEGKLGLDDKLSAVLPGIAQDVERADDITVRQLIRHTSGIPDFFGSGKFDPFDFTTYYPPLSLVRAAHELPRTGEPGEGFAYSNTNYVLLGMIIEKVSGHALPAELARRIFVPLGMTRSYLPTRPPQGIRGPHAHATSPTPQASPSTSTGRTPASAARQGGVISTAHDLSAFQRAFTQYKLLPEALQRVIGAPLPPPGGGLCGGKPVVRAVAGSGPGFTSVTFSTADGRTQFAVSAALKVDNTRFPPGCRERGRRGRPLPEDVTAGSHSVDTTGGARPRVEYPRMP